MTINQTTPESSPLDSLKANVHRNLRMISYLSDNLAGRIDEDHEHALEVLDIIRDMNYEALNEHVAMKFEMNGYFEQRMLAESAYKYDDGTDIIEKFESTGMTSEYYPRYDGNRDLAQALHYKSVSEMNLRFVEELEAKAAGLPWPPEDEGEADVEDEGQLGSTDDL